MLQEFTPVDRPRAAQRSHDLHLTVPLHCDRLAFAFPVTVFLTLTVAFLLVAWTKVFIWPPVLSLSGRNNCLIELQSLNLQNRAGGPCSSLASAWNKASLPDGEPAVQPDLCSLELFGPLRELWPPCCPLDGVNWIASLGADWQRGCFGGVFGPGGAAGRILPQRRGRCLAAAKQLWVLLEEPAQLAARVRVLESQCRTRSSELTSHKLRLFFFSLSKLYKLSPLYPGSAQKLRIQNVAEKRLQIYLLMLNCGSKGNIDNKPNVSETFFFFFK